MIPTLRFLVGLCPVFAFLGALIAIDSFKLVRLRAVLQAIIVGAVVAVICYIINSYLSSWSHLSHDSFSRYVSPIVEESFKALYLVLLFRMGRIGFTVDAAIFGFAVGAGFAFTENIYYLKLIPDASQLTWVVRGFGTAAMHGGATAAVGIVTRTLLDRWGTRSIAAYFPGLGLAIGLHSLFNHFLLPPVVSAAVLLVLLPLIIIAVFNRSEAATTQWLGMGFDAEFELLELITSDKVSHSYVGEYLENLRHRFPDDVVVDMLCYIHLRLELVLQAKGALIVRQANMRIPADPEIRDRFAELEHLERRIGTTGKLAIMPFLRNSSRDLWQFYMLLEDDSRESHSSHRRSLRSIFRR